MPAEFKRKYPHPTKKYEPLAHATAVTVFYIYIWIRDFLIALYDIIDLLLTPAGKERPAKPLVVRTPEERFKGLDKLGYIYEPKYLQLPYLPLRIHYVDEGPRDAPIILCLHGEPSWSFLYRKMINVLVGRGYRVVAPDMVGFGKSDKYVSPDNYSVELHMFTVKFLIEALDLKDITLVCQDWGGIAGLPVVADMPDMFSRLAIMNTALPAGPPKDKYRGGLTFMVWRSSMHAISTNLSVGWVFSKFMEFPPEVAAAYDAPFPDEDYKGGVEKYPMMVPLRPRDAAAPHMVKTRQVLREWNKPAVIMFGAKDKIMSDEGEDFLSMIPSAKHVVLPTANHFLQETHGEELAEHVAELMKEKM